MNTIFIADCPVCHQDHARVRVDLLPEPEFDTDSLKTYTHAGTCPVKGEIIYARCLAEDSK